MRGVGMQFALALACAAAIVGCGSDDDDMDPGPVNNAGTGGAMAGTGGGGAGGSGGTGGGAAIPPWAMSCMGDAEMHCPAATTQNDGVPCCTKDTDFMPYFTSHVAGVCGLFFANRVPCFELNAPGKMDDECPQDLDQGWGARPGCCHTNFKKCGILNDDTGCTMYLPTAKKPDGTAIGMMGSGSFSCTPD